MENENPLSALEGLMGQVGAQLIEATAEAKFQYAIVPWEAVNALAADGFVLIETIQPIVVGPARWASLGYDNIEGQAPGFFMRCKIGPAHEAAAMLARQAAVSAAGGTELETVLAERADQETPDVSGH
jgi:hypothetical protein